MFDFLETNVNGLKKNAEEVHTNERLAFPILLFPRLMGWAIVIQHVKFKVSRRNCSSFIFVILKF
jgi:hypothetical protein